MPYPNEHACRLQNPNYPKYARKNCAVKHNGKCIDFIYGIRGPNQSELQSMRYDKKIWDAADASAHCKSKKGTFEAASGRTTMDIYLKSEGQYVKKELSQDDYLNWFKSNTDDEGNVTEDCMLYKDADIEVNTDKSVTFVMSDDSLDRDFERFDTLGWDLKTYKKNPVLLWSHDRKMPAIGTMEKVRVKDKKLIGKPIFDEDDEFAMKIQSKVDKRIIKAGSVGFYPLKIDVNLDDDDPCILTYLKQELREFSLCNVPANPNALIIEDEKSTSSEFSATFIDTKEIGQLKDEVAEIKIDVENLKDMQMKVNVNIAGNNLYSELLKVKKPQPKGFKKLYLRQFTK